MGTVTDGRYQDSAGCDKLLIVKPPNLPASQSLRFPSSFLPVPTNTPIFIMTESDDDSQKSGGDYIDCCGVCEADEQLKELYICQACDLTLCSECWETQAAHKPKRKSSTRVEAIVHEKTKLSTIKLVQPAFSSPADESTIEARLAEDADTAWFGE